MKSVKRSEDPCTAVDIIVFSIRIYISMYMKKAASLKCLLHLILLFAFFSLQICVALDTISFTEPLQDPNTIVSSGQTFKMGFFSPENTTNRYVGIMFNIPKTSVVWVANRENPLTDSSGVVSIAGDGNLVVLNGKKEIVWSSNASNSMPNSSAQLLNDGNLVLRNPSNSGILWESFQNPTDTYLRGMKIGGGGNSSIQLTSWRSPSDPTPGSFVLGVDPQRVPEIFVWNRGTLHWRSGPWDGHVFLGVPDMGAEYRNGFHLQESDSGTEYFTYDYTDAADLLHYQLSFDGVAQGKLLNEGDWVESFSSAGTECDAYGKCGPNGLCNPKASPICSCLKGFVPTDGQEWTKGNWTNGCFRKALLECERNISSAHQGGEDGFLKFANLKLPHLSYLVDTPENCVNDCLKNCSCSASSYVLGIGCMLWSGNLIDIQQYANNGADFYIRVAHSELDSGGSKHKKIVIIATSVSVGCLFLAVSSYSFWNRLIKRRGMKQEADLSLTENGCETETLNCNSFEKSDLEELPLHSYEILALATNNFHILNKLGQGGFGPVYKGKLLNGQEIAVKRLSNSSSQGSKEFMNEAKFISKLQHRNLVRLLGCCVERAEKMLVYEYMPHKSLDLYLFDSEKQDILDWEKRCIIIEGIGRGLLYLHRDSRLRIIHRDMKASNILLDEDLNPKISDFGLARIFGGKQDEGNTNRVVGTFGYMAPEYVMGGHFSEKSDVYSFGVLLVEILSGKKNTSFYHEEGNLSLLGYAWKLWNESEAMNLAFTQKLDPSLEVEFKRSLQVGLLCVQDSADDRPNMFNVLVMLNGDIRDLPNPKVPSYTAAFSIFKVQDQRSQQSVPSVNMVSLTDVQGR